MRMKELIEEFPGQIEKGIEIFKANTPKAVSGKYTNVVISGLGGSGIGGTIIKDISTRFSNIPVSVNKEYSIPAFVNESTLFIASSYSGDTEETIAAVQEAIQKKATVICITSGGKLAQIAKEKGLDLLLIPGGSPPRANLGYSLTQLICIFSATGFIPSGFLQDLQNSIGFIRKNENIILERARSIAKDLFGKRVIIYTDASHEGAAVRFRQQLNENSKILCWHHVIPEMNHNELVGWTEKNDKEAVVFIRNTTDHSRNQHRFEINKGIVSQYCPTVIEIWGEGSNEVERTIYTIHLVDWITFFLAELKGVDIMDIKVIDFLKKKLSEIE
jgi:glucose/mannose-6-phosphate isomerase